MYSSSESSSDGDSSRSIGDGGDAHHNLLATALITTTALQDTDDDMDNDKVGEDETIITDTWSTRLSNIFFKRNYMKPGTNATGGPTDNDDPNELFALYETRCKSCDSCNITATCKNSGTTLCPGCKGTARTNNSLCYHLPLCEFFTKNQRELYQTAMAFHLEYFKGKCEHPIYIKYLQHVKDHTNPTFSLPLPPLGHPTVTDTSGTGATPVSTDNTTKRHEETIITSTQNPQTSTTSTRDTHDMTAYTDQTMALLRQLDEERAKHERNQRHLDDERLKHARDKKQLEDELDRLRNSQHMFGPPTTSTATTHSA